jgi:hypothetical protein
MNCFKSELQAINNELEKIELEILKAELDLKFKKEVLKKNYDKKRKLLTCYRF